MKRFLTVFIIFSTVFCLFSFSVYAKNDKNLLSEDQEKKIVSSLNDETIGLLNDLGIDDIEFDNIFNISFKKIINILKSMITGKTEAPTKSLVKLLSIIIILAICDCFTPENEGIKNVTEIAGVILCTISIISPLSDSITYCLSSIKLNEDFMLALVPVLSAVVFVTGNPTLAISFQSIAFACAQVISLISKNYIVPVVGSVLALDISGALMPSYRLSAITGLIKKSIIAVLSFLSTMFVSFLGIKGALANAADTVTTKGVKLIISSAVPIVGGSLSEAYSGIIGSLVLVKSTLGVFGIAAVALINLPAYIQITFWIFALKISAAVGELFNQNIISKMLKAISSALILLNVVLLFNAVLLIISIALLLMLKAV